MAEIKTIYKGESVTLLFTFPEAYDMARLISHKVFVGETEFAGVKDGQTIRLQLKSTDTDRMIGTHRIVCSINDTTLGLRKPYCGDLVVAKTQASGSTASVSNISDIIIPIVISETAITVGDVMYNYVKGDKGEPFTYSDFTPEQIAELQQPATDAIASIEAVELAVEQAEALRVTAEQYRQTNTGDAIQNAETATTNANNAASLANEKAGLANDAAILANEKAGLADTATTQANDARDGANSAAQSATNLVNSYATDLAAKELKANKQDSLTPDGTGTKFPTVDAVNIEFAKGNLIANYVHVNREIYVESVDIATGIFTSTNHGFTNPTYSVFPITNLNYNGYLWNVMPLGMTSISSGYTVNVIDANRFTLSGVTLQENPTMDLTKWHFELGRQINVNFTNIPTGINDVRVIIDARMFGAGNICNIVPNNVSTSEWMSATNTALGGVGLYPGSPIGGSIECTINTGSTISMFIRQVSISQGSSLNKNTYLLNTSGRVMNAVLNNITSINISSIVLANGARIRLYKL